MNIHSPNMFYLFHLVGEPVEPYLFCLFYSVYMVYFVSRLYFIDFQLSTFNSAEGGFVTTDL